MCYLTALDRKSAFQGHIRHDPEQCIICFNPYLGRNVGSAPCSIDHLTAPIRCWRLRNGIATGTIEVPAIKGISFKIPRQRFSMIVGPPCIAVGLFAMGFIGKASSPWPPTTIDPRVGLSMQPMRSSRVVLIRATTARLETVLVGLIFMSLDPHQAPLRVVC